MNVDLSSFLTQMTIYCTIGLKDQMRKTETKKGNKVKFDNCSFGFRTGPGDHFITLQVMSCNLLIADSSIGYADLRVQGINGQSSDWVEVKDSSCEEVVVGKCLISISRETLGTEDIGEGDYTHLV
jgi:hypothetical protein